MDISSIRLKQTLSARVASTGLQSSIPIGGSSTTALTSVDADIMYGFSITSCHASNTVKWTLDTHTLEQTESSTAPTSTKTIGASSSPADILDANGSAIPDANLALAIYYEIPSTTATDGWVQAVGTSADQANVFSTVKLVGHTGSSTGSRSAFLVPRAGCNSDRIQFSFNAVGVKVNVIYLANTTS